MSGLEETTIVEDGAVRQEPLLENKLPIDPQSSVNKTLLEINTNNDTAIMISHSHLQVKPV